MKKRKPARKPQPKKPASSAIVRVEQAQAQIVSVPEAIEKVLIKGDLSDLQPQDRLDYYKRVCTSLGLNTLTKPFDYILFREFEGSPPKLVLYANKSCTEQLRKIHGVSVLPPLRRELTEDICMVEADVRDRTGRTDSATGSVSLYKFKDGKRIKLADKELCNAIMKCETKAKRRATLSICGLAVLDESELDTVQVVGGVTPDGRIYQFREPNVPTNGSHEAAQEVAERKIAELTAKVGAPTKPAAEAPKQETVESSAPAASDTKQSAPVETKRTKNPDPKPIETKYALTIDWNMDRVNPVLTGDLEELGVHLAALKIPIKLIWSDAGFWKAEGKDVHFIMQVAGQHAFLVKEIQPNQVSSAGQQRSAPPAQGRPAGTGRSSPSAPATPPAGPAVIACTIERVNTGMAGKNPVKHVTVLLPDKTKPTYSCFDKKWFEALDAGLGKEAKLVTKQNGKYTNIIGALKIGSKEWLEDGTPAIQRSEQTPGRTLF
jgi:hypothetical protein